MIDRYSERDISALWDEYSRLKIMLDVELAVCQAWCEQGRIPVEALEDIKANAHFTVERVQEIEQKTQHDVVAFVSAVAENIGQNGRYLHLGMTSSDILDTASSIILCEYYSCCSSGIRLCSCGLGQEIQAPSDYRQNTRHPRRTYVFRATFPELARRTPPRQRQA